MAIDVRKFLVRFIEEARDHIDKLNDGLAALSEGEAARERIDALFRSAHTVKGSSRMLRLLPITETAHRFEDVLGALRDGSLTFDPALAALLFQATDALAAQVDRLAETLDAQSLAPADAALCQALAAAASGQEAAATAADSARASGAPGEAQGDGGGGLPASPGDGAAGTEATGAAVPPPGEAARTALSPQASAMARGQAPSGKGASPAAPETGSAEAGPAAPAASEAAARPSTRPEAGPPGGLAPEAPQAGAASAAPAAATAQPAADVSGPALPEAASAGCGPGAPVLSAAQPAPDVPRPELSQTRPADAAPVVPGAALAEAEPAGMAPAAPAAPPPGTASAMPPEAPPVMPPGAASAMPPEAAPVMPAGAAPAMPAGAAPAMPAGAAPVAHPAGPAATANTSPPPPDGQAGPEAQTGSAAATPQPEAAVGVAETVRVRLDKLDELIKLMGEVVSSHARMRQRLREVRDLEMALRDTLPEAEAARLHQCVRAFADDVQAQESLKAELHDKTLVMRMLPLAILFEPAARLVRELARSLGKQVACQVRGGAIELDRQMIDNLSDPITHLLRNSLDHGLEAAAVRLAAGKPPQGRVQLSARQDGGFVVIEVADDGAGIPLEAVRDKALKRGLVSPARAAALTEREMLDLIFLPGFSTKAGVSDMSGRGVGMDVVKQSVVGDLRGSVEVATRPGQGTTFSLRLPLSLAMMRVVLVAAQGATLAFTAQYVDEVARVPRQALLEAAGRQVVPLRGGLVPLVSLADLVRLPGTGPGWPKDLSGPRDTVLLLVLRVGGETLALRVDGLLDERDMVIKPLPAHMRRLTLVAGMVTTGDNALVSVLHAPALLELARRGGVARPPGTSALRQERRPYALLVVDDSASTREIEKDVLEAHGYAVTLAVDGQDGLEAAMAGDFDAILTDVEMPLLDGFELTSRLRREERYRHRPIVIITSRENEADKRRGLQVGADAYIVKGDFAQGSLVQTLRALLG